MYSLKERKAGLKIALLADALFVNVDELAKQIGADYWHLCFGSLRKEAVEEADAAGLTVNAGTINTARERKMAIDWELDGVITDAPHAFKTFFEKREAISS